VIQSSELPHFVNAKKGLFPRHTENNVSIIRTLYDTVISRRFLPQKYIGRNPTEYIQLQQPFPLSTDIYVIATTSYY
jgi:hypothetical protein